MELYLFIYTLIGWAIAFAAVTEEPTFFKRFFWPKVITTILIWPIAVFIYILLSASV